MDYKAFLEQMDIIILDITQHYQITSFGEKVLIVLAVVMFVCYIGAIFCLGIKKKVLQHLLTRISLLIVVSGFVAIAYAIFCPESKHLEKIYDSYDTYTIIIPKDGGALGEIHNLFDVVNENGSSVIEIKPKDTNSLEE